VPNSGIAVEELMLSERQAWRQQRGETLTGKTPLQDRANWQQRKRGFHRERVADGQSLDAGGKLGQLPWTSLPGCALSLSWADKIAASICVLSWLSVLVRFLPSFQAFNAPSRSPLASRHIPSRKYPSE